MGLSRPNEKYADQMAGADGCPDMGKHEYLDRALSLTERPRKLTVLLET